MKTTHHLSKILFAAFALVITIQCFAQQQPPQIGLLKEAPIFNINKSGPLLFDQISNPGGGYIVSQQFTSISNNTMTCAAADDFDVPAGETWDVHSIGIVGMYWPDAVGGGDTLNVYILADNNGMPGDTLYGYPDYTNFFKQETQVGQNVQTYFEIVLPSVLSFTQGTYWVSVQLQSNSIITGQWGWMDQQYQTGIYGAQWHWKNPKDGFGMGFTNWTPAGTFVGPWLLWELSFALYGEPQDNDLALLSIDSPEDYYGAPPTDPKPVTVLLKNEGLLPQTGFDVKYVFNGTEVIENIGSVTLNYNETYEYTFAQTIDLSTPGAYNLSVSTLLSGDQNPDNDNQSMDIVVFDPTYYTMPSMATTYDSTCSGTFVDAGGIDDSLTVDDLGTYTIYPVTPGSKIRLDFLQFDIGWSDFWIYDGENMSAPQLGYWEDTISPGTITASYQNTSGALTIHFEAQGWTPFEAPGWAAVISCHNPPADDFEVMKIELSNPAVFNNDYVTAYATIKNVGTSIFDKDVTFSDDGIAYATASTGMLTQSDTVVVEVTWNPATTGDHTLTATVPDDQGTNNNNSASMVQNVYPFDYFYEGFELELFPPDGWSQSGISWTHHDYAPAVGNGHAYLWAEYGLMDTLYTPKLHIEAGDKISFYAFSSAWWPGQLDLCWVDAETGVASLIQNVNLPFIWYQQFEIDVSAAAGDNYLAFVGKYNPAGGQGEVKLDEVEGIGIERFFYQDDLKAYILDGDITPEENTTDSFHINIKNIGSQAKLGTDYTVKLMLESGTELMSYPGQDIDPKEQIDFLMDYTFPSAGLYKCYVEVDLAGDEDPSNNVSNILNVYAQQEGTIQVNIGEGNDLESNWFYPIITQPTGLYSQSLYLADDVGDPNTITGIMYYYNLNENYPVYDIPITMWMSETTENNMSGPLEAANDYYLVFDGTVDFSPGTHGVYLPLDFVYNYQGGNLMVTTYKDYTELYLGTSTIAVSHVADTMVRYYNGYENGEPIDPYIQQSLDSVYLHQETEFANARFFKFNLEGQYCTPQVLNGTVAGDFIDGVSFNEIENLNTGGQGGPAYNNYTNLSSNVERGRTYELTIQAETSGTNGSIAAWIDFNGNQLFDDEGELVMHISSPESSQEITVQVRIPDDAAIGLTALRIRNSSSSDLFASCEAVDFGETEDYSLNIIETIPVYPPVPDFTATLVDAGNVDLNWSVPENPGDIHIEGFELSTWPPANGWEVKQSTTLDGTLLDPAGDSWMQYNTNMQYVYDGAYSALCPESAADFNWLISPNVQLYNNDQLDFMLNFSSDPAGYSRFYVRVEADDVWATVLEYTGDSTYYNNYSNQQSINLSAFAGKSVRIAFVSEYNDAYPIAIDDIVLGGVMNSGKSVSGITGYEIYRNDSLYADISDPATVTFPDLLTETEQYTYCIYAMYDDGEKSSELCGSVFYLAPLTKPVDLWAQAVDNDVTLNWFAPNAGINRFNDDFESYNVGGQVACQNPDDWTTWTLEPCSVNDPYVSDVVAYSGTQSVVNEGETDLLFLNDVMLESGIYTLNFKMYIPEGFNGYFNVLQDHDLTTGASWGMQAFFDTDGIGTLDAGGYGSATFNYAYDTWLYIEVNVDMDSDWSEFLINGELVHAWQWSTGISGGGGLNTLEGADFYAWNANGPAKFYIDDVRLTQKFESDALNSYNVFRDGNNIANVTSTQFLDMDASPGYHDYCVSAVYDEGESDQICDYVNIISAPENFVAVLQNENDVQCSWSEVVSSSLLGYQVYRDNELVSTLVTDPEWTDIGIDGGTHVYYVTAVYDAGESNPSNTATVVLLLTPADLVANPVDQDIVLNWNSVGEVQTGDMIKLTQNDGNAANGLYQWFNIGYGVVFDISAYPGASIEMADFHHSSFGVTGTWSYMFHVVDWNTFTEIGTVGPFQTTGDDIWELEIPLGSILANTTQVGIFLEPMSNDPEDAYPVLSEDAFLDGFSLMADLEDYSNNSPASGDFLLDLWIFAPSNGKMVQAQKIKVNNTYTPARKPFDPVKGNITVDQKPKGGKALLGYNIYYAYNSDPYELLDATVDTTYTHAGMAMIPGLHAYYVTADYDEGESDSSNVATVLISSVDGTDGETLEIYPNPFVREIFVKAGESIQSIQVVNELGQIIYDEQNINLFQTRIDLNKQKAGIYQLRIETESGWINRKMIKK